ncbi:MAG: MarR family transcriptional regulator [Gemmatimonadota bacterium]|nr:MarR family transcriptional regulator [Gemmatimonadota bacterium]
MKRPASSVGRRASGSDDVLRLWLRLLSATNLIEGRVRSRLRRDFATTLPRFDVLAQLDQTERGMTMSELSRRLMVSNGNVTGLTERLVRERLVSRTPSPTDRRTQLVRITPAGRRALRTMTPGHRAWIDDMFAGLSATDRAHLATLVAKLKRSVEASVVHEAAS